MRGPSLRVATLPSCQAVALEADSDGIGAFGPGDGQRQPIRQAERRRGAAAYL